MIRISVIIPTYDRRHVLERTLPLLFAQDFPPHEYEVIVVSDGSTDGTVEFLRGLQPKCTLRILESPRGGAGAARNVGIRAATGELVLFLDDDLLTSPDLLRQHCAAHTGAPPSAIQGRMKIAPDSARTIIRFAFERIEESYYGSISSHIDLRFPDGTSLIYVFSYLVNSSIPREALLRAEASMSNFSRLKNWIWDCVCGSWGLAFRYLPDAITYEYYVKSSAAYLRGQARALGAGHLRAGRKHPECRPQVGLANWMERPRRKRQLWMACTSLPFSLVPLLSLPLRLETSFYRFPNVRKLALRYLNAVETIAHLEGALGVAGSWKALEGEFARSCASLLYHHVGPLHPGAYRDLTVSPELFERQIRWLARKGYVGIRPSDWLNWIRHGKPLPAKPILLTFDDAYADIAEYAFPILKKYGFAAAVYVVTQRMGSTNTWDEAQGRGTLQLMTAEQIQYWATQGIEFGAHSRTHPHLPELPAPELAAEVAGSKNDLAALLGHPPVSFAYPYGECNEAVINVVRKEFDMAFSVEEGLNTLAGDLHLLRRTYIGPTDSLLEFALSVRRGGIRRLRDWRVKLALRTRLKRMLGIHPPQS